MTSIPTKQVVREDGLIELPIVLDFNYGDLDKVVGYAAVDPDMLPSGADWCLALGYVKHDDGRIEVTVLSPVADWSYHACLHERGVSTSPLPAQASPEPRQMLQPRHGYDILEIDYTPEN